MVRYTLGPLTFQWRFPYGDRRALLSFNHKLPTSQLAKCNNGGVISNVAGETAVQSSFSFKRVGVWW